MGGFSCPLCFPLCSFSLGLLLFLCHFAVQAGNVELLSQEEIAVAPALEPITEEQLNDLLSDEKYLGTLDFEATMLIARGITARKK